MSKYSVNVEELQKAVAVSNHVIHQFEKAGKQLKDANNYLRNQTGFGINDDKITLSTQTAVLDLQKRNMERIRDCIQLIIDKTTSTAQAAKKEMESINFEGIKDAAVIGVEAASGAAVAGAASTGASATSGAGAQRNGGGNNVYYAYGDGNANYNSGCGVYTYAMLFANLGAMSSNGTLITPTDIFNMNGNSVFLKYSFVEQLGYRKDASINLTGNSNSDKVTAIRDYLREHPEGAVLRWDGGYIDPNHNSIAHFVLATGVDDAGNVIINDPWYKGRQNIVLSNQNLGSLDRIHVINKV